MQTAPEGPAASQTDAEVEWEAHCNVGAISIATHPLYTGEVRPLSFPQVGSCPAGLFSNQRLSMVVSACDTANIMSMPCPTNTGLDERISKGSSPLWKMDSQAVGRS